MSIRFLVIMIWLFSSTQVLAGRSGSVRNAWQDNPSSDNPLGAWFVFGLVAIFWVWSIFTQLKEREYKEALRIAGLGLVFAAMWWFFFVFLLSYFIK